MSKPISNQRSRRTKDHGLTQKQEAFALEFVKSGVASEAYRRAYNTKMADNAVNSAASRMLTHEAVAARIAELRKESSERTGITVDRIANELARIAFADQRQVMSWDKRGVTLKDSTALRDDDAAIVAEVSQTVTVGGGSLKLKSHDKVRALELLGKHLGMFKEKSDAPPSAQERYPAPLPADPIEAAKTYKDIMG